MCFLSLSVIGVGDSAGGGTVAVGDVKSGVVSGVTLSPESDGEHADNTNPDEDKVSKTIANNLR